jgi:hypothetical protein
MNDQPLVHELPRRVTTLLDRYIRRFRPALALPGNPYLFPVGSTHKGSQGLSQQIRGALADWKGSPSALRSSIGVTDWNL